MTEELNCDVLVIGGGVTGVAAATASARGGARTILLENKPFVGGNATTGLCLHNYIARTGEQAVFGIAQELVDILIERGGAVGHVPYGGFVHSVTPVDGDLFRIVATEMLRRRRRRRSLRRQRSRCRTGRRRGHDRSRRHEGPVFRPSYDQDMIDSSGDADVAVAADADFPKAKSVPGRSAGLDVVRCFGTDNLKIFDAIGEGDAGWGKRAGLPRPIPVYFRGKFSKWNDIVFAKDKIFRTRTTWSSYDARLARPDQRQHRRSVRRGRHSTRCALSRATVELRGRLLADRRFLKHNVAWFEDTYYVPAAFAGVRETRNIVGHYEINEADIRAGRKFEDGIGMGCFPVDIHDPDTGQASFHQIGGDGTFDIPLRSMIPAGLDNVLVAGRCISADHFAHGTTRNMVACLTSGEGAGVAASMAAKAGVNMIDLDIAALQAELRDRGVLLSEGPEGA